MAEQQKKNQRMKQVLLILAVIALLIINAVKFYLDYLSSKEKDDLIAKKNQELQYTYRRIDSINKELEERVIELKKLGGNIDSLIVLQIELEKEKRRIQTSYTDLKQNYDEINDRLEGYTTLLQQQDEEIVRLKKVNQVLLAENTTLKTEKTKLSDSIIQLSQSKKDLLDKIETAAILKAEDIKINAVSNGGKEREGGEYKAKHIDQLHISFRLAENKVTKVEGKDIYIIVVDPNGEALYDISAGSGTFIYQDKELFYTLKQNILFDNTMQHLSFLYKRGAQYKPGLYLIDIYADGYKIGSSTFVVK